ncbi:MAG: acetylglutamate kinase [Dehalococcoidia bacterium]|nr:acetylglutamate kinase [Dehalococcoidia bacterium]
MPQQTQKLIVIKLGGSIIDSKDSAVRDVLRLSRAGYRLVLVHGGAKMVTQWMADLGLRAEFYQGERITDSRALSVVTAVLAGLANKETTAALIASGVKAVGISGADGGLIEGKIRDPKLGWLGDVVKVNPGVIESLLDGGFVPVISPVSLNSGIQKSDDPLLLNINGDTVAGEIAAAMKAEKLIFLTDVEGIRDSSEKLLGNVSMQSLAGLLDSGVAYGGMIPKLKACARAAESGVVCRIVDGRNPAAAYTAVETESGGTTISPVE